MRYCPKCNMNIRGDSDKCPLCSGATVPTVPSDGDAGDYGGVFPVVPTVLQKYNLILRIALFIAVAVSAVAVGINLMVPHTRLWSLYVIMGCGALWLTLLTALMRRHNIQKNILNLTLMLSVLSPVADLIIDWYGWSLDYVVPIMLTVCSVMIIVTAMILKTELSHYLMYLLISCIFGLVPILFLSMNWVRVIYPSFICIIVSVIIIAAMIVIYTNRLFAEMKRRLHM